MQVINSITGLFHLFKIKKLKSDFQELCELKINFGKAFSRIE